MAVAKVVLDIPTRQLMEPYDYAVAEDGDIPCAVGCTVLVDFSGRAAVGYVVAMEEDSVVERRRLKPVERVLTEPAFDGGAAELALWMAEEYAAPPQAALRLLLPPGQTIKVRREEGPDGSQGPWSLVCESMGTVDERWVVPTEAAATFTPRASAHRQRAVLDALAAGPQRMAELTATMGPVAAAVRSLEKRGVVTVELREKLRSVDATSLSSARAARPTELTRGQQEALAAIDRARAAGSGDVVLVDGITGSGKTEVYLEAIERTLAEGRGAIVLVPEISLTAQTVGRFRARFGDAVAILHSRLSTGERHDQWELIRRGDARVVVGARSALFAPLADVGLVVIDEEHESSYKQDQAPRYHSRDVAARLVAERGAALVLGSATPSLEALGRCETGRWRGARWERVVMDERPGGAELPGVSVVDMRQQFAQGQRSLFSRPLARALEQRWERGEKSVLLLNRRGFATFMMCRECGAVPTCPHCSTALTYHERTHELVCHSCGTRWPQRPFPDPSCRCPSCGSRYLAAFGVGTQRVEDELHLLLPEAPVIRMDADTTRTKGAHQRLLEEFDDTEGAILVGTQMIAKGLDFPDVTLVGVINADTTLKLPDFRAGERTYDLLEQVAGRAGRGEKPGEVIVQTYWPTHPAVAAVGLHDRDLFLDAERQERSEASYPPFARLSNVIVSGKDPSRVEAVAMELAEKCRGEVDGKEGWRVVGPSDCVKGKVKDRFRFHFLLKSPLDSSPGPLLQDLARSTDTTGTSVAIDVDAQDLL